MVKGFEVGDSAESQLNVMSYVYCLGELQALVNVTFDHARTGVSFRHEELTWDDFTNAYHVLGVDYERVQGLKGFTKRAIQRSGSNAST